MKVTIKQQILNHLDNGYTLTYGQANQITNSQSGYRRFQEILAENPKRYRFVKVKSENGGYYNVFGLPKSLTVSKITWSKDGINGYCVTDFNLKRLYNSTRSKTKKEAKAQIKKVVR